LCLTPSPQQKLLTAQELASVFSNATMLWKIHSELLKKFDADEEESIENLMFGEIFIRLAPFLKIYTRKPHHGFVFNCPRSADLSLSLQNIARQTRLRMTTSLRFAQRTRNSRNFLPKPTRTTPTAGSSIWSRF
jgi:RhoGEF domain